MALAPSSHMRDSCPSLRCPILSELSTLPGLQRLWRKFFFEAFLGSISRNVSAENMRLGRSYLAPQFFGRLPIQKGAWRELLPHCCSVSSAHRFTSASKTCGPSSVLTFSTMFLHTF